MKIALRHLVYTICLLWNANNLSAQWVTSVFPDSGAMNVDSATIIQASFSVDIDTTTLTNNSFQALGVASGQHPGRIAYDTNSRTATLAPNQPFTAGENVTVTLTPEIRNTAGDTMPSPVSWSFKIHFAMSPKMFSVTSVVAVDSGPWGSPAAGDWDRDGDLDLAVPCRWAPSVVILKNNGRGSFTRSQSIKIDRRPLAVAAGDFDGDSSLDIAVANWIGNTVQILMNDGTGSFAVSQSIPVGGNPEGIAVGDFDHDGDSDLVVAYTSGTTIEILENDGHGKFTRLSPISVEYGPIAVVVADLNRDGNEDLAVANLLSNSVSILKNDGVGHFTQTAVLGVGFNPAAIVCGDWDKDGAADLATINNFDGSISLLFGDDSAYFSRTATITSDNRYGRPLSAAVGDWNGDGSPDLALADGDWKAVLVLLNDGKGGFGDTSMIPVPGSAYGIVAGDWDGDGRIDLAVTHDVDNSVSILKNQPIIAGVGPRSTTTPGSFALRQNFPNPFNPSTSITYALARRAHVLLRIYDILGRLIGTLVNEENPPGEYTIRWNAARYPSGVYFYRLEAGVFTAVKKMIVAK